MSNLLLPASILILALTQLPGMVQSHNFNICVANVKKTYSHKSRTPKATQHIVSVQRCKG